MKIRLILLGMVAGGVLPLAGANAQARIDPGLNQAAGIGFERGAVRSAEDFGRKEDEDKGDKKGEDDKGDNHHKCDEGDRNDKGGQDGKGGKGGDDDKCDKSPSKPHH
jgi:hypothetical protein